jgi:L-amino acid N-acyltransferase YncA
VRMRDATLEDLASIVEIYNSTIPSRLVSADTEPVSVEQRLAWFYEHDPGRRPIRVAEVNGEVVGWLSLGDFWDGRPAYDATVEIGVYVKEGHRGEGIGRRLLQEIIGRAPDLGIKTMTAGAFAGNEASLKLFERFGFERWAHFPRVAELDGADRDLVVLGLRLEENIPGREGGPHAETMGDEPVDEEVLDPEEAERRITQFVTSADELPGPPVAQLAEQVAALMRAAWTDLEAVMDRKAHNKVLATQLLLSQRARGWQSNDPEQWRLYAAATLLSGMVVRNVEG